MNRRTPGGHQADWADWAEWAEKWIPPAARRAGRRALGRQGGLGTHEQADTRLTGPTGGLTGLKQVRRSGRVDPTCSP
eukprot:7688204-Pyramimonas_sp.AAC.1